MSTSSALRTIAGTEPPAPSSPLDGKVAAASHDLPGRQSAALRELLRLTAERAAAEKDVEETRASNDARVETEYAKSRQGFVDKYQALDREARADDEQRRRSIVNAAMTGEARTKADFASSSRRIAAEFDALRETAKSDYQRARGVAASQLEAGKRKAAGEHTKELQPISSAVQASDGFRERLARLAAEYVKFQLKPDPPAPARIVRQVPAAGGRGLQPAGTDGAGGQPAGKAGHPEDDEGCA